MILRLENTPIDFKPGAMTGEAVSAMQAALQQQRQQALEALRRNPATGRQVISISADISRWENTNADIELRAGDTLFIPKRPNFVVVSGQIYHPVAISYVPRKDLGWYLQNAGGPTSFGDKKHIYVLHADGSVFVPRDEQSIWMGGSFKNARMQPGDTIFVPEKIIGGSPVWQNILGVAQIMSAATLPLALGGVL
jgi:protein involved in polysaccharide export with SLBB domain